MLLLVVVVVVVVVVVLLLLLLLLLLTRCLCPAASAGRVLGGPDRGLPDRQRGRCGGRGARAAAAGLPHARRH
ncbi:MAG: hypothetical protein ACK41Y_16425 [Paracoccus hibiscisoli]|uniref:hypothetical protein n=1 Tax=Paracoccus hibiscisoli TaxID=2023261 RepID=UPI00391B5FCD